MNKSINLSKVEYYLYKADCGLRLLLIPNPYATIISYGAYISVGSLDETNEELGVAHFLEHMMFKGSKHYQGKKLVETLDNLGAMYNASTTYESTDYELHGLPQYHETLLNILLDMYYNPNIPEDAVNNERKIILEEYKMRKDNISYKQYVNFLKLITKEQNTKYNRPIIGTRESINKLNIDDLNRFRHKYNDYTKTIITISGCFNNEETLKMIKNIYQNITKTEINFYVDTTKLKETINDNIKLSFNTSLKIKLMDRYIYEKVDSEQTLIQIAFPAWFKFHENNLYLNIFSSILTDGMSGRITKVLRENNGLSYSQNSYLDTYETFGVFNISIGVNADKIYFALKLIFDVLNEVYINGINEIELNKTKNYNLMGLLVYFQKQSSYFSYFTESLFKYKKVETVDEIIEKYNKITINDVNNIIKQIINPKQMYISIVGSNKPNNKKMQKMFNYFSKLINT
jgi:zinc protease